MLVEFQPSAWGRGTYLNVGAMWLWYPKDHWTFDHGCRIHWRANGAFVSSPPLGQPGWRDYVAFVDPEQFSGAAELVAGVAARRTLQLREQFRDLASVLGRLTQRNGDLGDEGWLAYDTGVAAGLAGRSDTARQCLALVTGVTSGADWAVERARVAAELSDLADDRDSFRARVVDIIKGTRQRLRLPTIDAADLAPK